MDLSQHPNLSKIPSFGLKIGLINQTLQCFVARTNFFSEIFFVAQTINIVLATKKIVSEQKNSYWAFCDDLTGSHTCDL